MSEDKESELLLLLQPELMTPDQLIEIIKSRWPKVQNVTALSKDRLVRLFRQTVLPLPQRRYRTNRGGKLLTTRRRKAGLEQSEGDTSGRSSEKRPNPNDRLKPAPDSGTPNKIRITSSEKSGRSSDLDKIVINDRRRKDSDTKGDESRRRNEGSSGTVVLKRSSSDSDSRSQKCTSESPAKKQRTAIKWP
ncbi:UNVERIFIED_CONTAM: hypothetical protein PYX00_003916 [Menopon gallinae]|uniref:Ashwin n=1 Tax=Menopon gallinae TaxID=328185 RepID=A0AAW2I3E6_9NEOP